MRVTLHGRNGIGHRDAAKGSARFVSGGVFTSLRHQPHGEAHERRLARLALRACAL
jgi:hypothetical protein